MKQLFKALLFFMAIGFAGQEAKAQFHVLKIDSFSLLRDTLQYGDSVDFVYKLKNMSDTDIVFNDTIYTYFRTDLDTTRVLLDMRMVFIARNNSEEIKTRIGIKNPHFVNNQLSKVTIWVHGDENVVFSPNFDSIKMLVLVVPTVSIAETAKTLHNSLKFYPNPAKNIIYFDVLNPQNKIQRITLRDIQGRALRTFNTQFGQQSIALESINKGVYFLDVEFENMQRSTYRMVKTE